jgi:glycosyltransferase involved in cell wall biosynthesis
MIVKLLEELSRRPEMEKDYCFTLYFKDRVPDLPFLKAPIFKIKQISVPFFKNRLFPIYYFALLPMRLWFDRPDVMFWPNYMLPIIAFGKSLVVLTEDVYYETYGDGKSRKTTSRDKLPFRYRLAYGIFGWWTAKFATKIMAISETSKKNLAKLYGIEPERIVVNYLGIDLNQNAKIKMQNDPEPSRQGGSYGAGISKFKNNNYILFVGQAFPRRHLRETFLTFKKLAPEFPDLKLVAIGPDKYPELTINLLAAQVNKRLNREAIIHKDYVSSEELTELYADAKALIYVSDGEAFGLPPMEALSFGVPPVIADNELGHELFGARPEETKSLFGDYAFYSKSGNIDDITDAIKKALTENQKIDKIKSEGPEFVKKYNWKSFTDRFLEIAKI